MLTCFTERTDDAHRRLRTRNRHRHAHSGGNRSQGQEAARAVLAGVSAPGWTGKIDAREARAGQTLENAKLAQEGQALHVTTGPAVTYWNPANKAPATTR